MVAAHFQLYVLGRDVRTALLEQQLSRATSHLAGPVRIEVIDLLEEPDRADELDIVATPLVVRVHPGPQRRAVGDLGDPVRLWRALGIEPPAEEGST
jgi:circadian clock protein KaiB